MHATRQASHGAGASAKRGAVASLVVLLALSPVVSAASSDTAEPADVATRFESGSYASVAEALGGEVEPIFRFVADDVGYEPYSGVLRGAHGTFASRAGNSVDQSLLLAALLEAAGVPTRLAVGTVDEEAAERIIEGALIDPTTLRSQRAAALFGRLPSLGAPVPQLPTMEEYLPFPAAEADRAVMDLDGQLDEMLALIEGSLDAAQSDVEGGFTAVPDEELTSHTWVQASTAGGWLDLDPSLPDIALGESLTQAAEVMDEPPPEWFHTITIDVATEILEDGELVLSDPLRVEGTSVELADVPIGFTNVGADAVPQLARAFQQVLGVLGYRPILYAGEERIAGDEMLLDDPAAASGGGLGGGFFDGGAATDTTTAQWVTLTIRSPGREPVVSRRAIFDRVGSDARSAGVVDAEALADLPGIDLEGDGSFELAPLHTFWWLVVSTGVPSLDSPVIGLDEEDALWTSNVPFAHHLGMALHDVEVASRLGVRSFPDAPNVTGVVATAVLGDNDEPVLEGAIDIWHRSRGVAPVAGVPAAVAPAAVPGVMAHVVERAFGASTPETDVLAGPISAADVFEAAREQGLQTRVIDDVEALPSLGLSEAIGSRLREHVEQGMLVLIPDGPVKVGPTARTAWWIVDPTTGRVADELDQGGGINVVVGRIIVGIGIAGLMAWTVTAAVEFFNTHFYDEANKTIADEVGF